MQRMLPGEAGPAVHLDRALARGDRRLGGERLRRGRRDRRLLVVLRDAPRRPVRERARELDVCVRVRELVRDGLVDADRLAELLARRRVLDRRARARAGRCRRASAAIAARARGMSRWPGSGVPFVRSSRPTGATGRPTRAPRRAPPARCRPCRPPCRPSRATARARSPRPTISSAPTRPRRGLPARAPPGRSRPSRGRGRGRAHSRAPRAESPPRRTRGRRRPRLRRPTRRASRAPRARPSDRPACASQSRSSG